MRAYSSAIAASFLTGLGLLACGDVGGDTSSLPQIRVSCKDTTTEEGEVTAAGPGLRLSQVTDPKAECANRDVYVTGVVVGAVDQFDETQDGKSRGTIYVQDLESKNPYSGVSLFSPTFIPNNLRIAAGDVLDLQGSFVETKTIGATVDFGDESLPQMSQPIGTFRFDGRSPDPVIIKPEDLVDYASGRRWLGMLVKMENVTLTAKGISNKGRVTATISGEGRDAPTVTNELFDLPLDSLTQGKQYKSITGIVTYFFNLHISPRGPEDLVE